jgi:hypothetical protein
LEMSGVMDSHSFSRGTIVWTFDTLGRLQDSSRQLAASGDILHHRRSG